MVRLRLLIGRATSTGSLLDERKITSGLTGHKARSIPTGRSGLSRVLSACSKFGAGARRKADCPLVGRKSPEAARVPAFADQARGCYPRVPTAGGGGSIR